MAAAALCCRCSLLLPPAVVLLQLLSTVAAAACCCNHTLLLPPPLAAAHTPALSASVLCRVARSTNVWEKGGLFDLVVVCLSEGQLEVEVVVCWRWNVEETLVLPESG